MATMKCEYCGKEFQAKREWQKFCKPACRVASFNKQKFEREVEKRIAQEKVKA
jgi:hypothetical protein